MIMIVGRLQRSWFLGLMLCASCTGMLHEVGGRKDLDVTTSATFNMFTNSSYDTPTADWEVVTTDENFLYYECLVERTSQVTDEVTETGVWETCESPYDLREAPGIDVLEGFNGQLTVRAVSRSGAAGESITKPFRRAVWSGGLDGHVHSITSSSAGFLVGGDLTSIHESSSSALGRIGRLNPDGSVDLSARSFVQGFNALVKTAVTQDDGKILVGGNFTAYNGSYAAPDMFIRLNADGTVDSSFTGLTSGFDSDVWSIAVQDDGKILVGGEFTTYNGGAAPDRLVRLNSNGTIDTSFTGLTSGFNVGVTCIAIQDDGKILVVGSFTTYNGGAAPDRLVRLNSNGTIDATFTGLTSGFDAQVNSVVAQADGKILVGGSFTTYNGAAAPDSFIRLDANGAIDSTFTGLTSGFNNTVWAIATQDDGKILVGGDFTSYNGGSSPDKLIRLNSNGTIDTSFSGLLSGFDSEVLAIAIQVDGKILVGGNFTGYNGIASTSRLVRLSIDGTIDSSFAGLSTGFNAWVYSVAIQDDGKILVVGDFTVCNSGAAPDYLMSLNGDGAVDASFPGLTTGFDAMVASIAIQDDGKVLVGGEFTTYNGGEVPDYLIRLNNNGTIDTTFTGLTSGFDSFVTAIAIQDDARILVGGGFTTYNGGAAPDSLIRLNTNGTIDTTFTGLTSGFNGQINSIAIQDDGMILVGGNFTTYNGGAAPDGLIRLNTNGTIDSTFTGLTSGFNGWVNSIAIQDDGMILVGGNFTTYNGGAAPDMLLRLNGIGTIDSTFTGLTSGFNQPVASIAIQDNGKILVGGLFATYNGGAAPDNFIRLNSDGTIDLNFTGLTLGFNDYVDSIAFQPDGKILVGGSFTSYNGDVSAPDRIIRLNTDGSIDQSFMGQRK